MRTPTWAIVMVAATLAVGIAATGYLFQGGWTLEGALSATRLTARWAFPWFLAAWSASSLARLWPGGWRTVLLRRRRAAGLAFAANHGVHLVCLILAGAVFGDASAPIQLIGGGAVYVLIGLMAATSNETSVRWLGRKRWGLLHAIGGWGVLLVFTNSYVGRLGEKPLLAIPALTLILLAVGLRVAAWLRRHRAVQAA